MSFSYFSSFLLFCFLTHNVCKLDLHLTLCVSPSPAWKTAIRVRPDRSPTICFGLSPLCSGEMYTGVIGHSARIRNLLTGSQLHHSAQLWELAFLNIITKKSRNWASCSYPASQLYQVSDNHRHQDEHHQARALRARSLPRRRYRQTPIHHRHLRRPPHRTC